MAWLFNLLTRFNARMWMCITLIFLDIGCEGEKVWSVQSGPKSVQLEGASALPIRLDPATGIPISSAFQYPINGITQENFGFCFGGLNSAFTGKRHLGCDTRIEDTSYGTVVVAPADGIVRITTDIVDAKGVKGFGAYGSDYSGNDHYYGCLIVLEHMLQENGQIITDLIGHVQCESGAAYDVDAKKGNPPRGIVVRKGQYIGHVNHYWHGAGTSADWHHIHFGFRRGRFSIPSYDRNSQLLSYVRGYAPSSEFTYDTTAKRYRHKTWLDPIEFIDAHGDPVNRVDDRVLNHPPGSLLMSASGDAYLVKTGLEIAHIPTSAVAADRFDLSTAVRASDEEIACYNRAPEYVPMGEVELYKYVNEPAVKAAFINQRMSRTFLRWEALVSWGFGSTKINSNDAVAAYYDQWYSAGPALGLRPGTLVKGDAGGSEVSIVTPYGTRIPFFSGEVFEALGLNWNHVVSLPDNVLDAVAGTRENRAYDWTEMTTCAVPPPCPGGGACGGGGEADPPESGDLGPLLDESGDIVETTRTTGGASSVQTGGVSAGTGGASSVAATVSSTMTIIVGTGGGSSGETKAIPGSCIPYSTISCPCLVGSQVVDGSQTCAADGLSYNPCSCVSPRVQSSGGTSTSSPSTGGTNSTPSASEGAVPAVSASTGGVSIAVSSTGGSPSSTGSMPSVQAVSTGGVAQTPPLTGGITVISTGGTRTSSGGSPSSGGLLSASTSTSPLRLVYASPLCGSLHVEAWWTQIDGSNRSWGPITECIDTNPADCTLDCNLPIPSGTPYVEFQVFLPNGEGYGNQDCNKGGCGKPLGDLHLYKGSTEIPFTLTPNPAGPPYYNEVLQPVP